MPTQHLQKRTHHGYAVKRIREILHIKQDVLADGLGISQQSISLLENRESIEPETLEQIAAIMKVPVEAIKNFTDQTAINIISSTLYDNAGSVFYNPVYNPIEKLLETLEENKKLYDALLKEKDEKIALLERVLGKG